MNLWPLYYRLREARHGTARHPWASLAAVLIVALSLFLFGGFQGVGQTLSSLAALLEQQVSIRAFVAPGGDAAALAGEARAVPGVRAVTVITRDETFDRLAAVFAGRADLRAAFPDNPFADSLKITVGDPAEIEAVVSELQRLPGIDEVIYGQAYAADLLAAAAALRTTGTAVSVGFLGAAVLMVTVTMHLLILSRQAEIRIQRLMGVSDAGVRAQFLLEGGLLGTFGALLAGAALLFLFDRGAAALARLLPLGAVPSLEPVPIFLTVLVTGAVLGLSASLLAAHLALGREGR